MSNTTEDQIIDALKATLTALDHLNGERVTEYSKGIILIGLADDGMRLFVHEVHVNEAIGALERVKLDMMLDR